MNELIANAASAKREVPASASAAVTKPQTQEFRTGAMAGLSALRTIERIVERYRNGEVDSKSYFRDRELIKAAMVDSVGIDSPFLNGFLATLAEYIDAFMQDNDGPVLDVWKPESVMTASEIKAERAQIFEGEEAVNRIASLQGECMLEGARHD